MHKLIIMGFILSAVMAVDSANAVPARKLLSCGKKLQVYASDGKTLNAIIAGYQDPIAVARVASDSPGAIKLVSVDKQKGIVIYVETTLQQGLGYPAQLYIARETHGLFCHFADFSLFKCQALFAE